MLYKLLQSLHTKLDRYLYDESREMLEEKIDDLDYQVSELERKTEQHDYERETYRHSVRPRRVISYEEATAWGYDL